MKTTSFKRWLLAAVICFFISLFIYFQVEKYKVWITRETGMAKAPLDPALPASHESPGFEIAFLPTSDASPKETTFGIPFLGDVPCKNKTVGCKLTSKESGAQRHYNFATYLDAKGKLFALEYLKEGTSQTQRDSKRTERLYERTGEKILSINAGGLRDAASKVLHEILDWIQMDTVLNLRMYAVNWQTIKETKSDGSETFKTGNVVIVVVNGGEPLVTFSSGQSTSYARFVFNDQGKLLWRDNQVGGER